MLPPPAWDVQFERATNPELLDSDSPTIIRLELYSGNRTVRITSSPIGTLNQMKNWIGAILTLACIVLLADPRAASQLRWPDGPKKETMRIRLVAVVLSDPRSSFFSNHEIFIAEQEIGHEEWALIKLVYSYLPYQPQLSTTGFDYSLVHELSGTRNSSCDQTLADLTLRQGPEPGHIKLKYSHDAPNRQLDRRRIPLPCFETTADDYTRVTSEPVPGPPPALPALVKRQPQ